MSERPGPAPRGRSLQPRERELGRTRPLPRWLPALVRLADDRFRVPGTRLRVGLDAIVGALLPGIGDAASAVVASAVLMVAWRRGAPRRLLFRMLSNIAIDVGVGTVPVLGDLFDAAYKANRKNLDLLVAHEGQAVAGAEPASGKRVALLLAAVLAMLVTIPVGVTLLVGYWVLK